VNEYDLERQREIDDGNRAKVILESVEPYIAQMESNLIDQFKLCSISVGSDTLLMIKLQLRAVQSLRQLISDVVSTGDMAYKELYGDVNGSYQ
jgi:hypothetical protein